MKPIIKRQELFLCNFESAMHTPASNKFFLSPEIKRTFGRKFIIMTPYRLQCCGRPFRRRTGVALKIYVCTISDIKFYYTEVSLIAAYRRKFRRKYFCNKVEIFVFFIKRMLPKVAEGY